MKLPIVVEALEGRAYIWYQFWKWHNPDATGWEVVKSVVMRFQPEYERYFNDKDSIIAGGRSGLSMGETESEPLLEKWEVKKVVEGVMTKRVISELVAEEEGVPVKMKDKLIVHYAQKQHQKEEEEPSKKAKQMMDSEVATIEKDI